MPNFRLNDEQIKAISAYVWQSALADPLPKHKRKRGHGQSCLKSRGCWHVTPSARAIIAGGTFAANLTRVVRKRQLRYLVRWVHHARERNASLLALRKEDIGPEDYKKKGQPIFLTLEHSRCRRWTRAASAEMTVMPSLRLSPQMRRRR